MQRRQLIAGLGATVAAGFAGCLGTVGMAEHEASPAGVDADTRSETGYRQTNVEPITVSEPVGAAGYSEEVTVLNYLTEHDKSVDLGPLGEQEAAVFTVLTTPQVSILGQEFNPVGDMSTRELVDLLEDDYDEIENIDHEADDTIEILGQKTTESLFSADAQFDGSDVDVYIHVTESVEAGEDLLVTIGVYPEQFDEEAENVRTLMSSVVETVDEDGDDAGSDGADDDSDDDGGLY